MTSYMILQCDIIIILSTDVTVDVFRYCTLKNYVACRPVDLPEVMAATTATMTSMTKVMTWMTKAKTVFNRKTTPIDRTAVANTSATASDDVTTISAARRI